MEKVVLHPNVIFCDNCQEVKIKKGYNIHQTEEGEQLDFCSDCVQDLWEYMENEDESSSG